jgi:carbon storage regulator CsrA
MLVLSRKAGQRIHIGDGITVEIRRIAGNRVTIALDAPKEVRILRGELEEPVREFELSIDDLPRQTLKLSRGRSVARELVG